MEGNLFSNHTSRKASRDRYDFTAVSFTIPHRIFYSGFKVQ